MEGGEIIERGNHYDLINRTDSVYKRLNSMQEVLQ
jgi:subfamily B ATP-binding cassette protein MsbA